MTSQPAPVAAGALDPFAAGFFLGLLVGEGHFGGDGRQAQVTVRMHTRHEGLFRWLETTFPGSKLYGPYTHGGRSYYQWMARGPVLREVIVPLVAAYLPQLDGHVAARFRSMCERYGLTAEVVHSP
jgi:hypothetical protein